MDKRALVLLVVVIVLVVIYYVLFVKNKSAASGGGGGAAAAAGGPPVFVGSSQTNQNQQPVVPPTPPPAPTPVRIPPSPPTPPPTPPPQPLAPPQQQPTQPVGVWVTSDYNNCNVTCGGGWQYRNIQCRDAATQQQVADSVCDATQKPSASRACNQQACPPPPPLPPPGQVWVNKPAVSTEPAAQPPPPPPIPRADRCSRVGTNPPGLSPGACRTVSGVTMWLQHGQDPSNPCYNTSLQDYNPQNVWCWNCPAGVFEGTAQCW